jgi:hypothetical protein
MVGRGHRCVLEPDGSADRSGKKLDRAPCQLGAQGKRNPYLPFPEKNGERLTTSEAATTLGVTHHRIRRLSKAGILPGEQVVPGAPYQIGTNDLQQERVAAAIGRTGRPCRIVPANQLPMLPDN